MRCLKGSGLMYTQRDPNNSAGLTHTKESLSGQMHGGVGVKMEENCSDLISPSTLENWSPLGANTCSKTSLRRPVMSCGYLRWRMDTILQMGSTPSIHMVEGLLTSSGCPERCSHLDIAKRQAQKEAQARSSCYSAPRWGFSYLPPTCLLSRTSPLFTSQAKLAQERARD